MHKLFSEHIEFKKWKPEFWTWLDKNYQHHTVDETELTDTGITIIDDASRRNFDSLLGVIRCWELKLPRKNHKPVIVKSLVNGSCSKTKLCDDLFQANPTDTTLISAESYGYIGAFIDLVDENIVRIHDDIFELVEKLDQLITDIKRSEASRKANVTRGEEGRSEAARKAWDSRREKQTEEEQKIEIPPRSYEYIMKFLNEKLDPKILKANYQPRMIKYLLEYGASNRAVIASWLQKKNPAKQRDLNFFENVPVYDVLLQYGIVKIIRMKTRSADIFELNIEKGHRNQILQKLNDILDEYENGESKKNHENRYARETTPEILKKAITEWKCDKCDFQAKDEFELQEHKQRKKHFTDD